MTKDFKDVMSQKTDEELITIVTIRRNDYQTIAVEAAEEEIKIRGIETTKAEEIKNDIVEKLNVQNKFDSRKVNSLIRLINHLIDSIAILIIFLILDFFVGLFFNAINVFRTILLNYILLGIIFFGYYIFMEFKYQKTFGKQITGTKVLRSDGERAQMGDIVARTLCRLIPLNRISFLFTPNGFHDRLSNTTIVKDNEKIT